MRKGFTMIELIFVIVILGVLATVAVPKLTTTREDAEVAKAATNLTTLIGDIGAYYTSQAGFASSFSMMTNVSFADAIRPNQNGQNRSTGSEIVGELLTANKRCIQILLFPNIGSDEKPAYLKISAGTDANEAICKRILDMQGIKTIFNSQFSYKKKSVDANSDVATYTNELSGIGEIAISGIGVKF